MSASGLLYTHMHTHAHTQIYTHACISHITQMAKMLMFASEYQSKSFGFLDYNELSYLHKDAKKWNLSNTHCESEAKCCDVTTLKNSWPYL